MIKLGRHKIINLYEPYDGAPKIHEVKMTELKGEIVNSSYSWSSRNMFQ